MRRITALFLCFMFFGTLYGEELKTKDCLGNEVRVGDKLVCDSPDHRGKIYKCTAIYKTNECLTNSQWVVLRPVDFILGYSQGCESFLVYEKWRLKESWWERFKKYISWFYSFQG